MTAGVIEMAIDFSTTVYLPQYNAFARPIVVTPLVSQPNAAAYDARGIFDTDPMDVETLDGGVISDMRTILDILESEFTVLPTQGDRITIPAYLSLAAEGTFEVLDGNGNAGGETTLALRRIVTSKP